ncbi:MAG: hypothetical protein R3Y05_05830 [bacterium]
MKIKEVESKKVDKFLCGDTIYTAFELEKIMYEKGNITLSDAIDLGSVQAERLSSSIELLEDFLFNSDLKVKERLPLIALIRLLKIEILEYCKLSNVQEEILLTLEDKVKKSKLPLD